MGYFDDIFDPKFMWDNEHKQRSDIESLRSAVRNAPDWRPLIRAQAERIDRLELSCKALVELVVAKGVATRAELSVLMQQIDLADGVEDGRASTSVRQTSPRCAQCGRYVNPRRTGCIYCGAAIEAALPKTDAPPPVAAPDVRCGRCGTTVPENETYFTAAGLVCESCFDPSEA